MKVKYPGLLARLPQRGTPKPRAYVLVLEYEGGDILIGGLFSSLDAALKFAEDGYEEVFEEVQLWYGPEWVCNYDSKGNVTARAK